MQTPAERLDFFVKKYYKNQDEFINTICDVVKIGRAKLTKYIGSDTPSTVKSAFRDNDLLLIKERTGLNPAWYRFGEFAGPDKLNPGERLNVEPGRANTTGAPYYYKPINLLITDDGFDGSVKPDGTININIFDVPDFYAVVNSNDLQPEIKPGDFVALKNIAKTDIINLGKTFLIVAQTNGARSLMFRKLLNTSKSDTYLLTSIDGDPKLDMVIKKSDIKALFELKGAIKTF